MKDNSKSNFCKNNFNFFLGTVLLGCGVTEKGIVNRGTENQPFLVSSENLIAKHYVQMPKIINQINLPTDEGIRRMSNFHGYAIKNLKTKTPAYLLWVWIPLRQDGLCLKTEFYLFGQL